MLGLLVRGRLAAILLRAGLLLDISWLLQRIDCVLLHHLVFQEHHGELGHVVQVEIDERVQKQDRQNAVHCGFIVLHLRVQLVRDGQNFGVCGGAGAVDCHVNRRGVGEHHNDEVQDRENQPEDVEIHWQIVHRDQDERDQLYYCRQRSARAGVGRS